jgi:hypothetical protein
MLEIYNSDIPTEYIREIGKADLFDTMDGPGIVALYRRKVPAKYITAMGTADIFDNMNAREALALYNRGVPASFYQELSENEIDNLNFSDVLTLFQGN